MLHVSIDETQPRFHLLPQSDNELGPQLFHAGFRSGTCPTPTLPIRLVNVAFVQHASDRNSHRFHF